MIHIIKNDSFIYRSQEHTNLLQMFLDPQKHALIYNDVETFLGSHSREKCVYKGKCVSILIKGKHNTWLARRLTTYKYEN
jgi:hypothetical protein